MIILEKFITFIGKILEFKILGLSLIDYLIAFTIIIFIFKIFQVLGNNSKKGND